MVLRIRAWGPSSREIFLPHFPGSFFMLHLIYVPDLEARFLKPLKNPAKWTVAHPPGPRLMVPDANPHCVLAKRIPPPGPPSFPPHLCCVPFSLRLCSLTRTSSFLWASRSPILEGLQSRQLCSSMVPRVEGGHGVTRERLHCFHSPKVSPEGAPN